MQSRMLSDLKFTPRCKHGVDLSEEKSCPQCKSLWDNLDHDEDYELENFFKRGIATIAGSRGRIKELEKQLERALNQSPIVTCASCDEPMRTVQSRVRDVSAPFHLAFVKEATEVKYVCPTPHCDRVVWVAKLKGLL